MELSQGARKREYVGPLCIALKKAQLATAAAVDWCCDSWGDSRAHIIGLGRVQFERHLNNPALIPEREASSDYRESFAYCIPFPEDYELMSDHGYAEGLRDVRKFVDMLNEADRDDIPLRLYRRFDEARHVAARLLARDWPAAVTAYHAAYGEGYADDWPFAHWCGYLIPNIVRDLKRYRLR